MPFSARETNMTNYPFDQNQDKTSSLVSNLVPLLAFILSLLTDTFHVGFSLSCYIVKHFTRTSLFRNAGEWHQVMFPNALR